MNRLDTARTALLSLSHELGAENRDFAILGEGNASALVDEQSFVVKASGSSLRTVTGEDLVACDAARLLTLMDQEHASDQEIEDALFASRLDADSKKPSVEALFHAYLLSLPGIHFVGHTHPVAVNGLLCSRHSRAFAFERRFPDEIVCCGPSSVLVPYCDPGFQLACDIRQTVEDYRAKWEQTPRLILLENHGLIAMGASPTAVLAATLMAEKAARIFQGAAMGEVRALSPKNVARIANRSDEHYRQRALRL